MIGAPIDPGRIEEARLSQSVAAAAAERRNRPRFLVVAAAGMLLLAAAYATAAGRGLSTARGEVRLQREQARAVMGLAEEVRRLSAAASGDALPPDPQTTSKLEALADRLPLVKPTKVLQSAATGGGQGTVKRLFTTKLTSAEPQAILEWLAEATGGEVVAGLELQSVKLRPVRNVHSGAPGTRAEPGWEADVTLSRLQRGS